MNKPLTPTPMLEPTTQAFIDSLAGGQPIQTLAPAEARAVLSGVQKAAEVPLLDVQIKDVTLPLGPTGSVNIRVVRPAGGAGVLPSGAYHLESPTTVTERDVEAWEVVLSESPAEV